MQKESPIQKEYLETMNELARALDHTFNPDMQKKETGFVLLVFPFGDGLKEGRINYISNAVREDVICSLKELLANFEGRFIESSAVN